MSNDLLEIWAKAVEHEHNADKDGLVLRIKFESPQQACHARLELYRLRTRARKASRRNTSPDEPHYDTSPWDQFKLVQPGAGRSGYAGGEPVLEIYTLGTSRFNFELQIPGLPPEKPAKRRAPKTGQT